MDFPTVRALVVEDSPSDADLIRLALRQAPGARFDVVVTERLDTAIALLRERAFDVALLDLGLPDSAGPATFARVRSAFPALPIIIMTGVGDDAAGVAAIREGVQDYLMKGSADSGSVARSIRYAIERKRAEVALKRSARRDEILSDAAAQLLATDNPQGLVESLCRNVMGFLDCSAFFNFLVDERAGKLRLNACAGITDDEAGRIEWLDYGVAVCGCAARDGERIVAEDISSTLDPRTSLVRSYGIEAYCCHPLMAKGIVIGTLSFGASSRSHFSGDDISMMKSVADLVAMAMARVSDERILRESEERLATVFRASPAGIFITRLADGLFVDVNDAYLRLIGYSADEIIGHTSPGLNLWVDPNARKRIFDLIREQGRVDGFEIQLRRKSGEVVDLLVSALPLERGGEACALGTLMDITARKRAEESLMKAHGQLVLAQESARAGIWTWDLPSGRLEWSPELFRIYGLDPSGCKATFDVWRSVLHPDDREGAQERINDAIRDRTRLENEYRIVSPTGEVRWISALGDATYDDAREPLTMSGICIDITERKRAEEALKRLNDELERRVAERTKELATTVDRLQVEVVERTKAEESALRLNRLYSVLSETNQAIVRSKNRAALFDDFCRIAVENGGFMLAWVGLVDQASGQFGIVAASGATGYLDGIRITVSEEPTGRGPTGIAIRGGTHCICNDFLGSPLTAPWHERGRAHGIRASASIALKQEGRVIGALTLYADKKDFFDQQQVELFRQMGEDVSFALDNMAHETRRQESERALREKELMLVQQSRQAAMGEMIGNIAHQWRQPLNALGLTVQQLSFHYDLGELDKELLDKSVSRSMELVRHMSRTIDDFRNYFRPDKEKSEFGVREAITLTLSLIEASFRNQHIGLDVIENDDPVICGHKNEFAQVLLNILNNARDAVAERGIADPRVTVTVGSEEGRAVVTVADNAGGIPEEIMAKIFDPYFTTKGPHAGTGLGLFMSKAIIEKNMGGRLTARNQADGAEFRIEV